jgi:nucleolar protein 9
METIKKTRRGKRGGGNKPEDKTFIGQTKEEPPRKKTRRSKKTQEQDEFVEKVEFNQEETNEVLPELDHETRNYFIEIEKQIRSQEFETMEEQQLFLSNVFDELDGKEVLIATDYETSRILEKLLKSASDFQLRVFSDRLNGSFAELFSHQFASHVCQTLLNLGSVVVDKEVRKIL